MRRASLKPVDNSVHKTPTTNRGSEVTKKKRAQRWARLQVKRREPNLAALITPDSQVICAGPQRRAMAWARIPKLIEISRRRKNSKALQVAPAMTACVIRRSTIERAMASRSLRLRLQRAVEVILAARGNGLIEARHNAPGKSHMKAGAKYKPHIRCRCIASRIIAFNADGHFTMLSYRVVSGRPGASVRLWLGAPHVGQYPRLLRHFPALSAPLAGNRSVLA
jgi:hypothetical protein